MKKRLITTLTALMLFLPGAHALANDAGAPVAALDAGAAPAEAEPAPEAPAAPTEASEVPQPEAPTEKADTDGAEAPDPGVFKDLYDAGKGGDWRAFVILLLMFVVSFTRWLASRWDRLDEMLNREGDWAGAMLVFGLSFLGAFASAWKADAAFDFGLFQASWENAVLAFGGYSVVWKKLVKPKLGFVE